MSSPVLAITTSCSPTSSSIPRASLAPPVPPASRTTGELTAAEYKFRHAMTPERVRIREGGPRDGFQNEPEIVPTDAKVRLIDLLARTGVQRLEATSFVRADVIPQLAGAGGVLGRIAPPPEGAVSVLIPNEKGLENALMPAI